MHTHALPGGRNDVDLLLGILRPLVFVVPPGGPNSDDRRRGLRESPNGETALLSTYSVGNTIGEAHAALGDRFADSAVCAVECRVFVLSCTDLNKLLSEIPKLQIGLMATVSRHLDEANEDLEILKTLNSGQVENMALYMFKDL